MHWLDVNGAAILDLGVSCMYFMVFGFLLFVLIKTYMNMGLWFVKIKKKNRSLKLKMGDSGFGNNLSIFGFFSFECSSCSPEKHCLEY
jgi:hypothetical protein